MRRCVGCMTSKEKNQLIRIAGYEGKVSVDMTGKAKGRGVYICPDEDCLKKALKRNAIQRSLDIQVDEAVKEQLAEDLKKAIEELTDK